MADIKIELDEVSQKFDFNEIFETDVSRAIKKEFMERAKNLMLARTEQHKDINGNRFEKYSKGYANKKGVSRSAVDMLLTSSMLSSIPAKVKRDGTGEMRVNGKTNTLKAFNHNSGDTLPQREFFGVNDDEIERVARSIKRDYPDAFKKKETEEVKADDRPKAKPKTEKEKQNLKELLSAIESFGLEQVGE